MVTVSNRLRTPKFDEDSWLEIGRPESQLLYLQRYFHLTSSKSRDFVIKAFIYPFIAAQVAVEMIVADGRDELRKALHHVLIDTLSDAKEINELKAEIAVLRAEINQVRYDRSSGSGKKKVGV